MWKYSFYLIAFVAIVLTSPGCGSGPSEVQARLNEEFSLSMGQRALIVGEDLQIRFEEVVEDSRCPKNVTCVWAGRVSCIVELTNTSSSYRMVLTEAGLTDRHAKEAYKEYQLTFHVKPYPEAGKEIAADEYRLLLVLSK